MARWTDPVATDAYYTAHRPAILGIRGVAATGHYLGSLGARDVLQQGGNAIDAGVAAGLCLNVVQPEMTSLGGVAPIMIYHAESDRVITIDGLGWWPRAASIAFFRDRCGGDMPVGILRSVVPAAADAWLTALEGYGTMSFETVAAPALELAEHGFPVYRFLHRILLNDVADYQQWPSTAATLLRSNAAPPIGTILVQRELAATLRRMIAAERAAAVNGRAAGLRAARAEFYEGETAARLVRFCGAEGGLLSAEDLATYRVKIEEPVHVDYRGFTVYACGPWCQGPVLLQMLNLLEGFDVTSLDHGSAEHLHLLVECMKLAFADREAFYGDPEFVDVPLPGLLSKEFAALRRRSVHPEAAAPDLPPPGDPYAFQDGKPARRPDRPAAGGTGARTRWQLDTSYLCVVDRWGNAMSATPSDSASTSPLVPDVGCIISSRGSQSWLDEGHPSALAPGKRPRLTPSPAMAFRGGRPFLAFGTPGGDYQPQAMLQVFSNVVDFGIDLQTAIEHERVISHGFPNSFWPHTYTPGLICLEPAHPNGVAQDLGRRGHRVERLTPWLRHQRTGVCAIQVDASTGVMTGAADSRRESYAVGW